MPPAPRSYTGPGSCSATPCHGSVLPRKESSVLQNEYTTWILHDKHAQAYTVLSNETSVRMLKILDLPAPNNGNPEKAPKCLACHALDVPLGQQGRTFKISDGVSCDSCHGPSAAWLGDHTTRGWDYARSLKCGMYDTRNLVERSKKCLSCHIGTAEKSVDHAMIAAGHPDLYFELSSFEANMPRHWKYPPTDDSWIGVRSLAVGDAVQLRASLQRLIARANQSNGPWPEYSELDCYACHHSLTLSKDSWRQARGYSDGRLVGPPRRPGDPPYTQSHYVVFQKIVEQFDSGASGRLAEEMKQVSNEMSKLRPVRTQVAQSAGVAFETAGGIVNSLLSAQFDEAKAFQLMRSISSDPATVSDERSAEQAAMALGSLFAGLPDATRDEHAELGKKINALFEEFQNPSSYDALKFARKMSDVSKLL
jgi:hypothetical protein